MSQEYGNRWNPSSPNIVPVAKERHQLGVRETLEKITGMEVDSSEQQQKDMGVGEKVGDVVKALEKSDSGNAVNMADGNQVKKVGLLGRLDKVMNNQQLDKGNMNEFGLWEEVEGNGRGFKRTKSSSLSPPTVKKKVKSLLGNIEVMATQ